MKPSFSFVSIIIAIIGVVFAGIVMFNQNKTLSKKGLQPIITISHDSVASVPISDIKLSWDTLFTGKATYYVKLDSQQMPNNTAAWKYKRIIPGETYHIRTTPVSATMRMSQEKATLIQKKNDSQIVSDLTDKISDATTKAKANQPLDMKLIIKAVFSFIFTLAALYVILSKKYDAETQKWAFGILSLITGIWLGTASA